MRRHLRDSVYRWGVLLVLVMLGMLGTLNRVAVAADADTLVLALEPIRITWTRICTSSASAS